jgi:hypothetical protein
VATVAISAGAALPLTVSTRLALSGYQLTLRGQASIGRSRELAHLAGLANAGALDALAGDPVSLDLTAEGPWMAAQGPAPRLPSAGIAFAEAGSLPLPVRADSLTGTVILHDVNWKADYLANHVEISQATLHLGEGELRWDPVVFSYGPVKGTASLTLPAACDAPQSCLPTFQLQFGALNAAVLQAAFLGAHERSTLLSTLIDRLHSTAAPAWPRLEGTVKAESLTLGPVTLHEPSAAVSTLPNGAEFSAFTAGLLGGHIRGSGIFHASTSAQDKPTYSFEGQFEKLSPPEVGRLLGERWSGGAFDGNGKIELAGFTASDLAASAKGAFQFEWHHGAVSAASGVSMVPPALARFDRWTAGGEIASGHLTLNETLKENQVRHGDHSVPVQATVTLSDPPKVIFEAPKRSQAKR